MKKWKELSLIGNITGIVFGAQVLIVLSLSLIAFYSSGCAKKVLPVSTAPRDTTVKPNTGTSNLPVYSISDFSILATNYQTSMITENYPDQTITVSLYPVAAANGVSFPNLAIYSPGELNFTVYSPLNVGWSSSATATGTEYSFMSKASQISAFKTPNSIAFELTLAVKVVGGVRTFDPDNSGIWIMDCSIEADCSEFYAFASFTSLQKL